MEEPQDLRATGDRIEHLIGTLRDVADPGAFDLASELFALVNELYGAGLAGSSSWPKRRTLDLVRALVADDLVASLLLVHGLHPDSLATRVESGLARVRPMLATHGGDAELLDVDAGAGAVLLRLLGSCDGCPSSTVTLRTAVERAIIEAAPEIVTIDVAEPSSAEPSGAAPSVPVNLGTKPPRYEECPAEMADT